MLRDLQTRFLQGIYQNDRAIYVQLSEQHLTAEQQIDIYRNSIFGGLLKALTDVYPVTARLVGSDFFNALCLRYITRTPSHHPDINRYGRSLADFTRDFPPAGSLPYLPDVMQLEWAWHRALQVDDDQESNTIEHLATLPYEQLTDVVLLLHPSVTVLRSLYPVLTIWQVNQQDYAGDQTVNLDDGGQDLMIWRSGSDLRIDRLTVEQADWLCAVTAGKTLGEMQSLKNFTSNTTDLLQAGYISGYRIKCRNTFI